MKLYALQTSVRCTREQRARWQEAADALNMPLQQWMRLVLCTASGEDQLEEQLHRIRSSAHLSK